MIKSRASQMAELQMKNSHSKSFQFDERKDKDGVGRAVLATLPAALASFSFGYCLGYSSSALEDLQNDYTFFTISLSVEQGSWFSSLISFGLVIGCPIGGWALETFGRKGTMMMCSIPFVLGWLLISYTQSVAMLYAGRFITGVACGAVSFTTPVYVAEIASARVRGMLANLRGLSFTLGVLTSLALGVLCQWRWLAFIGAVPPTLVLILMIPMPQSPRWLLGKNRTVDALEVLSWLRGPEADVDEECSVIKDTLDRQGRLQFTDIRTATIAKPLIICVGIFMFTEFSGIDAVLFNAANVFKIAGIANEKLVAISVGISQLLGNILSCLLVDKIGRRKLLLTSALGMCVSLIVLGLFFEIYIPPIDSGPERDADAFNGSTSLSVSAKEISWLPTSSIFLFNLIFAFAWGPLPWVLISEVFPQRARGFACSFATIVYGVTQFIVTKTYHSMATAFTTQGVYWVYAGFCLLGFTFVYFLLPETTGKTLEEIEDLFDRSGKQAYERIE